MRSFGKLKIHDGSEAIVSNMFKRYLNLTILHLVVAVPSDQSLFLRQETRGVI